MIIRDMDRYQKGKIYTIRSCHTAKFYIGSTCLPLCKRLYKHKKDYRHYQEGKYRFTTSFIILEKGDFYIELLENYPCGSKEQLEKREGELIRQYQNDCVNITINGRTKKEWYEDNKDKVNQKRSELITCECGSILRYDGLHKHKKTKKHNKYISQQRK